MNRIISAAIAALVCAAPVQAQPEHGRFDFPFTVNGQEHVLTYEGTSRRAERRTESGIPGVGCRRFGGRSR